jgi:ribosomal protein L19E
MHTGNVCHRRTKNCGRKRISIDENQIREIPLSQRTNIRSLAGALKINPTSLFRLIKSGAIRREVLVKY